LHHYIIKYLTVRGGSEIKVFIRSPDLGFWYGTLVSILYTYPYKAIYVGCEGLLGPHSRGRRGVHKYKKGSKNDIYRQGKIKVFILSGGFQSGLP